MSTAGPNGIHRGHPAVLKDAGEGALRSRRGANIHAGVENPARIIGRKISQVIDNRNARENAGAERVDVHRLRSEGLADCAVDLFANEAEDFRNTEVGPNGLAVRDGRDLATGVQVLAETLDRRKPERRRGGIVLVVILQRQSVFGSWQVVEIRNSLVGYEISRLREKNILRES